MIGAWLLLWAWLGERVVAEVEAAGSQFLCDAHRIASPDEPSWHRCRWGECLRHGCRSCAPCSYRMDDLYVRSPGDRACGFCGYVYLDPERDLERERLYRARWRVHAAR